MSSLDKRVSVLESHRVLNQSLISPEQAERIFYEVCQSNGIDPRKMLKSHGSLGKASAALMERLENIQ